MTEEEKEEKREVFTEWITFIEDRVDSWKESLDLDFANRLDYQPESLKIVEEYILSNYNKDSLSNQDYKMPLDALISYFGETFRRNLSKTHWFIDLEEDSFFFNVPALKSPIGTLISPHYLMRRVIQKNRGTFLYDSYIKRLGFIENPETY